MSTDRLELQEWTIRLAQWFMPHGRQGEPVQLFVTRSELTSLTSQGGDLLSDLRNVVAGNPPGDPTRHERSLAKAWRSRLDPEEPPPGLPFVVAEVLVCGEQVEAGSLKFYEPLSEELGCRQLVAEAAYEQCFAPFWTDLTWWLETVNSGDRGFPTWKSIPLRGPRSVIGRPYTQMLLRREDWRDMEAFVEAVGDDDSLDFEVVDRDRLASLLLEQFRAWAARERRISPRLLSILAGNRKGDLDTLSYLILERLTGNRAGQRAGSARALSLIVTLDDYEDRTLRVGVLAPPTTSTLTLDDEVLILDEPGCPYPTAIALTADLLDAGASLSGSGGEVLVYRPRDAVALAERTWSVWSSVNSVDAGERVYVLCKEQLEPKVKRLMEDPKVARSIGGVPPGWVLLGPSPIASPSSTDHALVGLNRRKALVPTLTGGLRVQQGRVYLEGGSPDVVFPDDSAERRVLVDNVMVKHDGSKVLRLSELDLPVGRHGVTVEGVLRLNFDIVDPGWAIASQPGAWRTGDGNFVAVGPGARVAGVLLEPPDDRWLTLLPVAAQAVVIGDSPRFSFFSPAEAPWAERLGLPFNSFDPLDRMAYPGGDRPHFIPRLAAVRLGDGRWHVIALPGFELMDASRVDPLWRAAMADVMASGHFRHDPRRPDHQRRWVALQEEVKC